MKVLLVNNFHYKRGGSDVVYLNTSELLQREGHSVVHFSMEDEENEPSPYSRYFVKRENFLKAGAAKQLINSFKFFYSFSARISLMRLIKKEKPDIAHLHIFYGGLTSSILGVLRKYKIPVIITLHEYKLICPVYTFLDGRDQICEKCAGRRYFFCAVKRCNKGNFFYSVIMAMEGYFRDLFYPPEEYFERVICVSKFSLFKHAQYKGALKDKLTHLYNFSPILEKAASQATHSGYYLYFGRLSREKGIFTLLKAWDQFPVDNLKIVGSGPLLGEIREAADAFSNIEILGYQSGEALYSLVRSARFVIIPSEWYENNPMTIVESYFMGTPVIGARIGGIPEIVIEGKTGFLFEPKNVIALTAAITLSKAVNEEEYFEMSQSCRTFAERNFSSKSHYRALLQIYTSAIEK